MPTYFTLREIQEICTNESVALGLRFQLAYLGIGHHLAAGTEIGVLIEGPFPGLEGAAADLEAKKMLYGYSLCSGYHNDYKREPHALEKLAALASSVGFANKGGLFASIHGELGGSTEKAQRKYIDLARRAADTIIERDPDLAVEEIDVDAVNVKSSVKDNFNYDGIRALREAIDKASAEAEAASKAEAELGADGEGEGARQEAARVEATELASKVGSIVIGSRSPSADGRAEADDDARDRVVVEEATATGTAVVVTQQPKPPLS